MKRTTDEIVSLYVFDAVLVLTYFVMVILKMKWCKPNNDDDDDHDNSFC